MAFLDPLLRSPLHDRAGHESAHLAAMGWYGYSADFLRLDLKHGDYGHYGLLEGVRLRTGDPEREAYDRSTIAAIGPLLGGTSLDHLSSAGDRRCIDLNAEPRWSVDAWRFVATERARSLARTPAFAATWRNSSFGSAISASSTSNSTTTRSTGFSQRSPAPGLLQARPRSLEFSYEPDWPGLDDGPPGGLRGAEGPLPILAAGGLRSPCQRSYLSGAEGPEVT